MKGRVDHDLFDRKSVLITGGVGMVGANLVTTLSENPSVRIFIADDLSSGKLNFLSDKENVFFYHTDISKMDQLRVVWSECNPDYVFHLAAHFANWNSIISPYTDIQSNIVGTLNCLELAREKKNLKKFVYTSSSCVYSQSNDMSENASLYPTDTPYAINKFTSELYVKFYSDYYKIPGISLRLFNAYGPYDVSGKFRSVIPNFINKALRGEDLVITGSGNEMRDFTYVSDVVNLLILAATSKETGAFNAGTGEGVKILDLAKTILKLTSSRSKLRFIEKRDWDKVSCRIANTEKSFERLEYRPSVSIQEGLKCTIAWFRLHEVQLKEKLLKPKNDFFMREREAGAMAL